MVRMRSALALRLDFGEPWGDAGQPRLRLATAGPGLQTARPGVRSANGPIVVLDPEKYRMLDLRRRRAQIRARRVLGV